MFEQCTMTTALTFPPANCDSVLHTTCVKHVLVEMDEAGVVQATEMIPRRAGAGIHSRVEDWSVQTMDIL